MFSMKGKISFMLLDLTLSREDGDVVAQPIHSSGFCPVLDPTVNWM